LRFGGVEVDEFGVEPDVGGVEAGGVTESGQRSASGGVSGEGVGELVGVDAVRIDAGPGRVRVCGCWWLPGEGFADAVRVEELPGLVVDELACRWG
jgi:hypothetical protein